MEMIQLKGRNQSDVWINIEQISSVTCDLRQENEEGKEKYFTLIRMAGSSDTFVIDEGIGEVMYKILKKNSKANL